MALLTPVELPELADLGPVHFIAIGGSGMNGIATMMLASGVPVSGSDRQDSKYLRTLEAARGPGVRGTPGRAAGRRPDRGGLLGHPRGQSGARGGPAPEGCGCCTAVRRSAR